MRLCLYAVMAGVMSRAALADHATPVMEATFKLFHEKSTATCFLLKRGPEDSRLYLVTAAHTLERTTGETAILVLREAKPDGSYTRKDQTVKVRAGDKPLWTRHPKQDVAVLRLAEAPQVPVTALPADVLADGKKLASAGARIGSPLLVLSYPQRVESDGAGFPVARQGIFAGPPLLPSATHPTFLADFTTFAGDSGGPVFIADPAGRPLIAGIVLAQKHHEEKLTSEYEQATVKHPLNLGVVLHASYVMETLEEAAKAP